MKKCVFRFSFILALPVAIVIAAPPAFMWVGTYTINDYVNEQDLPLSHAEGASLVNGLENAIRARYPAVSFGNHVTVQDRAVKNALWGPQSKMQECDLVFFAGHGTLDGIEVIRDDGNADVIVKHSAYGPVNPNWGGYGRLFTKWVIFRSCEVLWNTNTTRYINAGIINGVHTLCGYQSISWQFIKNYNCRRYLWWTVCDSHVESQEILSTFASLWVNDGWSIGTGWSRANELVHYNRYTLGAGGAGIAPAVLYVEGQNASTGITVSGGWETFANCYDDRIPYPAVPGGAITGTIVRYAYWIYGTPQY